ncbi:MAG TPA: FUSC family protein [Chthoniobacterales bacterium]|nr:FUSC family protein [Chthoniobacterales bacterium]
MSSRAISMATLRQRAQQDLFADLRVRYGIKMGLAGLLALFCTQVLRLPHDNWAILTVVVLMSAQFVGSIAFKAIMRVIGTIAGAFVGVWLVGDYTSTPAIFLPVLFLVMAFTSYKFGQLGARQVPYAYYLLGFTALTIATDGVTDPAQAWQIGLDRTEEILVGIMSSLLVMSILWPRYAREEFIEAGRAALKTVNQLVSAHGQASIEPANAHSETATGGRAYSRAEIHDTFDQQLSVLRNLQQAGARESTFFSARLSNYNAFLVSLINLFHAGLYLSRHRVEPWFLDHMRQETESLLTAISDEFNILTTARSPNEKLHSSRLNEAFAAFQEKVNKTRDEGVLITAPLQTAIAFAGHFAAIRSVCDELNNIRSAMEGLPRFGQPLPDAKPHWDFLPTIDWFWVKVGVKGGLAAVIAVLLLKWINPPGSASIPPMAWILTIFGRSFLQAGGTGDLRAFQNGFLKALTLVGCVLLLILTTPFLAGYAVMNLVLFLILFIFGFLTARSPGINSWMLVGFLTISVFVGLNPQVPVPSQTIIDTFLGLGIGIGIGTVVGRLIWPVLPQRLLQDNLLTLFAQIGALLSGDSHREKIQTQLAILPVEALQAARQIRIAGCGEEERAKLVALVRALQTLITQISQLLSRRDRLPEITEQTLKPQFERLEIEFKQMLDAFAECFRQNDCRFQLPTVRGALTEMDNAIQQIRDRNMLAGLTFEAPLRVLDLVERYHATADALDECGRLLRTLQLQRYRGDYGL